MIQLLNPASNINRVLRPPGRADGIQPEIVGGREWVTSRTIIWLSGTSDVESERRPDHNVKSWLNASATDLLAQLERMEADVPQDELAAWLDAFNTL